MSRFWGRDGRRRPEFVASVSRCVRSPSSKSPDPHPAIDDDVDPGHVGALVRGQEERDVRHFLGPAEPAQQHLVEHVVGPVRIVELVLGRVAFDQPGRDRVGADPVLPPLHGQLELVEAAVRCGQREQASRAFERVRETTSAAGTDWGLGIEARLRALLAEDDDAEAHYEESLTRLGRTSIRVQLARTHLLYCEWLRRRRRRLNAREQLRIAHELFTDSGIEAFAERTRVELEATGEHARKRSTETLDQLTAKESEISRLVAEALTNREIATRLSISPSTVEYHLRKVFRKLDVKSRTQLAGRLT